MKTVKGKIKNGKINLDFEGFTGKACDIEEEKLLSNLKETEVEDRENKPEYYEEENEFNTEIEGGW